MENYKETAVIAAQRAGKLLLDRWGGKTGLKISEKERYDFATELDVRSEEIIVSTIKEQFPNHSIFSEELTKESPKEGYRWIIDPLDGTTNYIHNYPAFAVSIALEHEGEIILGLVYDPLREEHFFGARGKGAFLNDVPIHVSSNSKMEESLIATGFPIRCHQYLDPYLTSFKRLFDEVSGIRRCGAAALDLAYVACGRCDAFWEVRLSPWDIAAGSVLVQEAGGVISDFRGTERHIWTGSVVAANQAIHHKILKIIQAIFERENLP
jgi:myo-inositol-1(or 4)-monophosphatase